MAELQLQGGGLVLHLSGAEKAEAVRGDLRVPAPWDEWIVGCADPGAAAATLAPAS